MKLLSNKAGLFLLLALPVFFYACSDAPPEIIQMYAQPNILRDETDSELLYQFSVFLHLEDEDGIDDIESIYLIHDQEELFWELNSENWVTVTTNDESWIGSNSIAFPGSLAPAHGLFRIIVIDAAGERTADELYLQPPVKSGGIAFPTLVATEENTLRIQGKYAEHTLWYYDESGNILESYKTSEKTAPFPESAERVAKVYIYAYSNEYGCGVLSGPYKLPDS